MLRAASALVLLLLACSRHPVEMTENLHRFEAESEVLLKRLSDKIGQDVVSGIGGWVVRVSSSETFVSCADSKTAIGCTSLSFSTKEAWIRLAMAPDWSLSKTSFMHEMLHVYLAATTGDGDPSHSMEIWSALTTTQR